MTTKATKTMYTTTWTQCRDELARLDAQYEGISYAQAKRAIIPGVVTAIWFREILTAVASGRRVSTRVLRELEGHFENRGTLGWLVRSNPKYDWSYAQPLIRQLSAREPAAV